MPERELNHLSFPATEAAAAPALFSAEVFRIVMRAAVEELGEAAALGLLAEAGAGRYRSLAQFFQDLSPGACLPARLCCLAYSLALREGASVEKIARRYVLKREASALYYYTALRAVGMAGQDGYLPRGLDLITATYLCQDRVEWTVGNCFLIDVHLERLSGRTRKVIVTHLLLRPEIRCWAHFLSTHHLLRLFPLPFRGRPARVRHLHKTEFRLTDPVFPGTPLEMGRRPSLKELAEGRGLRIEESPAGLCLAGKLFAVPDHHPARGGPPGLYRIIQDVAAGPRGGAVFLGPSREGRPLNSLLFGRGHRYGIDFDIPVWEFEVSYEVRLALHFALWPLLLLLRLIWGRVGGSDEPPWETLARQIHPEEGGYLAAAPGPAPVDPALVRLENLIREEGLTARESEVVRRVLAGKSNPDIALEFGVAEITVKTHMKNIFQKTGFKNRRELFAFLHSGEREEDDED